MTKRDGITIINMHTTAEAEQTRLWVVLIMFFFISKMDLEPKYNYFGAAIVVVLQTIATVLAWLRLKLMVGKINEEDNQR